LLLLEHDLSGKPVSTSDRFRSKPFSGSCSECRSVAQSGSAPRSGRGGRRFKSCHSDQYLAEINSHPAKGSAKTSRGTALEHFDVDYIARFLARQAWLEEVGALWSVTGSGLLKADELREKISASSQAFVAMWIDASLDAIWADGLQKGISEAGYKPLRIDKKDHANKICDEIISEIRRSRFLVADYTGHRGGVYYEAEYAAGRNLPVILTCRKSDMDGLHFDIRQYNCIGWETADELARRLQVRIEAVIGDGPLKTK
jgi:hypothetical protein